MGMTGNLWESRVMEVDVAGDARGWKQLSQNSGGDVNEIAK